MAKLNIDENPEVTRRYGVMSIPTLMLFKDGEEKARMVGARGKEALLRRDRARTSPRRRPAGSGRSGSAGSPRPPVDSRP